MAAAIETDFRRRYLRFLNQLAAAHWGYPPSEIRYRGASVVAALRRISAMHSRGLVDSASSSIQFYGVVNYVCHTDFGCLAKVTELNRAAEKNVVDTLAEVIGHCAAAGDFAARGILEGMMNAGTGGRRGWIASD